MVKCSGSGCKGESSPSFPPFPKGQYGQGALRERSLRSLLPLRSPSCLDPRKTERQRGVHIHTRICVFCLYQEKARRSLRTLRLIFSSSSEGAEIWPIKKFDVNSSIKKSRAPGHGQEKKKSRGSPSRVLHGPAFRAEGPEGASGKPGVCSPATPRQFSGAPGSPSLSPREARFFPDPFP